MLASDYAGELAPDDVETVLGGGCEEPPGGCGVHERQVVPLSLDEGDVDELAEFLRADDYENGGSALHESGERAQTFA